MLLLLTGVLIGCILSFLGWIFWPDLTVRPLAQQAARAHMSEEWRRNRPVSDVYARHKIYCNGGVEPRGLGTAKQCECVTGRQTIAYRDYLGQRLELRTADLSPRQLQRFQKHYQNAVQAMIQRDRTFETLESFMSEIQRSEGSRRDALRELRSEP